MERIEALITLILDLMRETEMAQADAIAQIMEVTAGETTEQVIARLK